MVVDKETFHSSDSAFARHWNDSFIVNRDENCQGLDAETDQ